MQPHLRKVFENINLLEFDDKKRMHAMFSAEKERVSFVKIINPVGKNVEDWMNEVEEEMCLSIRHALLSSIKDYPTRKRIEWCLAHPG